MTAIGLLVRDGASFSEGSNAKPHDDFAGLHRFATCRGFISSRHRNVCRPVLAGFGVVLSEISSIGLLPFTTSRNAWPSPRLISRDSRHALYRLLRFSESGLSSNIMARLVAARSPQVHPQQGRAQQRNIRAATGSSVVSLKIHREPNHRSAFSSRLSQVQVKRYRRLSAGWSDLGQ